VVIIESAKIKYLVIGLKIKEDIDSVQFMI